MLSWAVTRGPSLIPGDKRLAIHVEDHPIEYNKFEGTIPEGQYGGGTVMVWDRGTWTPEHDPHKGMQKGHLDFELHGEKLKGHWHLVRMRKRPGERQEPWLLIKATDEFARKKSESGHPGRDGEFGRDRPDHGRDRRRQEAGLAFQPAAPRNSPKPPKRRQRRPNRPKPQSGDAAPKPRARTPRRQTQAKGRGKVAGARKGRLPDFIPPSPGDAQRKAPDTRRLGPRDQVRRLPHAGADRRRQGHAEDPHRPRLDRKVSAPSPRPVLRFRWPRRHPRRRDRLDRRERRLRFLCVAGRSQDRPPRPAGLLRIRPAASRRPGSDRLRH